MKRIAIAALAGGVVFFIWSAIAHMALPLGTLGLSTLPDEAQTLAALKSSVPRDGLYSFPGIDMSRELSKEEQAAWEARLKSGPTGLLVIRLGAGEALSPRRLLSELATNVLAAALAAFLVSLLAAAYPRRVLAVALLGLFGWLSLELSLWIWYGFPTSFIVGEGITEVVGWFLVGLAIARIVPSATAARSI